jgi:hypothetical protein
MDHTKSIACPKYRINLEIFNKKTKSVELKGGTPIR